MTFRSMATAMAATVALVATSGGFSPAEAVIEAGANGRLDGRFDMALTIDEDTLHPDEVGTAFERVWKFNSTCEGTRPCRTVKFTRISPGGSTSSWNLTKVAPGTWEGSVTYAAGGSWWCTMNDEVVWRQTGKTTETVRAQVTRVRNGKARRIAVTASIVWPALTDADIQPEECADWVAGLGIELGESPVQRVSGTGTLR